MRRLCISLLALAVSTAAHAEGKPNIVLMFADNLGYGELGSYGGGITRGAPTPRLDALAREGTRLGPACDVRLFNTFQASLKQYPPIAPGTPDPYTPPAAP